MTRFPDGVEAALRNDTFIRRDDTCIERACADLGVAPSLGFREFFETFSGGYRSETVGRLLLDPCEGSPTIVGLTLLARETFALPDRYLILSELEAGSVLVYDCETDRVYDMDFEGGDEALVAGALEPGWTSFAAFLREFFR